MLCEFFYVDMKKKHPFTPETTRMYQRVDSLQVQLAEAISFGRLSKAWMTDRLIHHQKILHPTWLSHKKLRHKRSHPTVSIPLSTACKNMCVWGRKDRSLASTLFLFPPCLWHPNKPLPHEKQKRRESQMMDPMPSPLLPQGNVNSLIARELTTSYIVLFISVP